jgi:hypothetical protein
LRLAGEPRFLQSARELFTDVERPMFRQLQVVSVGGRARRFAAHVEQDLRQIPTGAQACGHISHNAIQFGLVGGAKTIIVNVEVREVDVIDRRAFDASVPNNDSLSRLMPPGTVHCPGLARKLFVWTAISGRQLAATGHLTAEW